MIEDDIFESDLKNLKSKRTKSMYEPSRWPHKCNMWLDEESKMAGYKLKPEYVECLNTPYMFICEECYNELED